jgi:hypothetical protein
MCRLTFQACIFSGFVCSTCGVALDALQLRPHRLEQHRMAPNPLTFVTDDSLTADDVLTILEEETWQLAKRILASSR